MGRLKPGVSTEQAAADLTVIVHRLAKINPQEYPRQFAVHMGTLGDSVVERISATLYTILAAVGLLLLIACSNVANLMLARATVREKEFALRTVLGAGRTRIVRLLIVESAGAGDGRRRARDLPRLEWTEGARGRAAAACHPFRVGDRAECAGAHGDARHRGADGADVWSGASAAIVSAGPGDPLRDSGKGMSGGFRGRRLRDAVVVLEVALSLTLLIGAGLLMRSFVALRELRLGLQADHILTACVQLPADRYATAEQVTAFLQPMLARVKALPGVVHAAASTSGALDGGAQSGLEIAGKAPDSAWRTTFRQVTDEYFRALRLEFKDGRPFSEADVNDARKVAVVNETFVRMYLPDDHPIGQRVRLTKLETAADPVRDAWFEIVGVVGDVRNRGLRMSIEPEVWIPSTIAGSPLQVLIVRTAQDPSTLTNAVRSTKCRPPMQAFL